MNEETYKDKTSGVCLQNGSSFEGLLFRLFGLAAMDHLRIDVAEQTFVATLVGGIRGARWSEGWRRNLSVSNFILSCADWRRESSEDTYCREQETPSTRESGQDCKKREYAEQRIPKDPADKVRHAVATRPPAFLRGPVHQPASFARTT